MALSLFTNLCQAAQPVTVPDSKKSLTPSYSTPSPTLAASKPKITSVTPSCISPGKKIIISGAHFGTASGKSVALSGSGIHLDLPISAWKETTINVSIPKSSKLKPGVSYDLGIENLSHKTWLSNLYKGIVLCKEVHAPAKQTTIESETSMSPSTSTIDDSGSADSTADQTMWSAPAGDNSTGSLSSLKLPDPPQVPAAQAGKDDEVEPGEVLVFSANMQDAEALRQNVTSMGMRIIRRSNMPGIGLVLSVIRLPAGMPVSEGLQQLRAQFPDIWFDGNTRYRLQGESTAPDPKHYGFDLIGWPTQNQCGHNVRIGMIDSAIDVQHPALKQQRIRQKSFLPSGINPSSQDHGTAIAALLVGHDLENKFVGLLGAAELRAAGVFRQNPDDSVDTTTELIVRGLDWLIGEQVAVINFSLGGKRNLILEAATQRALDAGVVVVAAAGNSGPAAAPVYPAAQTGVIAVTAVDARKRIYEKSNRGDYIAIAAPGVDVWSAAQGGHGRYYSGTSYAVPFVTAYFALRGKQQLASRQQQMQKQALDLGDNGRDNIYGWGLLQAKAPCSGKSRSK